MSCTLPINSIGNATMQPNTFNPGNRLSELDGEPLDSKQNG